MNKLRVLAVFSCLLIACAIGADSKLTDGSPISYITSVNSSMRFAYPVYHKVQIGDWLTVSGKEKPEGQSVTIYSPDVFGATDTDVFTTREPTITKLENGKWKISFK